MQHPTTFNQTDNYYLQLNNQQFQDEFTTIANYANDVETFVLPPTPITQFITNNNYGYTPNTTFNTSHITHQPSTKYVSIKESFYSTTAMTIASKKHIFFRCVLF